MERLYSPKVKGQNSKPQPKAQDYRAKRFKSSISFLSYTEVLTHNL